MNMVEIKQSRSAAETLQRRMRDSGDTSTASHVIKSGEGVRRTIHHVHPSGHQAQHGPDNKGEPGIDGRMRGPADQGAGR
jgi:hypothetical protein